MLSVSWIPRLCLSWIPRQYCCYIDTFAAALWLVRWFWVIIFGKAEKFKLIQFYINGTCFDWHEKSQSTNRDTHKWCQNCSMSSNNGRLWWSGSLFITGTKLQKYEYLCDIGALVWINLRKIVHNVMFVYNNIIELSKISRIICLYCIQEEMPRIASSIKSWNSGNLWFLQSDWFVLQDLRFCGVRDKAACRQCL